LLFLTLEVSIDYICDAVHTSLRLYFETRKVDRGARLSSRPIDRRRRSQDRVRQWEGSDLLAVERWHDFPEFGGYLGNVGAKGKRRGPIRQPAALSPAHRSMAMPRRLLIIGVYRVPQGSWHQTGSWPHQDCPASWPRGDRPSSWPRRDSSR